MSVTYGNISCVHSDDVLRYIDRVIEQVSKFN